MIEVEHDIKAIPIDDNLHQEIEKLTADGWELMAGVPPLAIYHVVRAKNRSKAAVAGGIGQLGIDESKVMIMRNGKVVG